MHPARREDTINSYTRALDEDDPQLLEEILTPDFTWNYADGRSFEGREAALAYFTEERSIETDHVFETIHHLDACSIGLGQAEVRGSDGYEADMADVFVFHDDYRLREVTIYTRPIE
jgi:hypothetical protein